MPGVAIIRAARPRLGSLWLEAEDRPIYDGVTGTTFEMRSIVGEEPLEDGRMTHDHVTRLPIKVIVKVVIGTMVDAATPSKTLFALNTMRKTGEVFRAQFENITLDECVLTKVDARQEKSQRGFLADIEIQEIIRVGVAAQDLPPETVTGPAEDRTGAEDNGTVPLGPTHDMFGAQGYRRHEMSTQFGGPII